MLLEEKYVGEQSISKKNLSKKLLVENLRETDGIIETSSNVSNPFQTSNEDILVNENENKTVFKLQITEM